MSDVLLVVRLILDLCWRPATIIHHHNQTSAVNHRSRLIGRLCACRHGLSVFCRFKGGQLQNEKKNTYRSTRWMVRANQQNARRLYRDFGTHKRRRRRRIRWCAYNRKYWCFDGRCAKRACMIVCVCPSLSIQSVSSSESCIRTQCALCHAIVPLISAILLCSPPRTPNLYPNHNTASIRALWPRRKSRKLI